MRFELLFRGILCFIDILFTTGFVIHAIYKVIAVTGCIVYSTCCCGIDGPCFVDFQAVSALFNVFWSSLTGFEFEHTYT